MTKTMILSCSHCLLDLLQFACRRRRGVADAVATPLEEAKTHNKVLYLDISFAFNTSRVV